MARRGLKANGKLKRGCTFKKGGAIVCGPAAKRLLAARRRKVRGASRRRGRGRTRATSFCRRCKEYC